MSSTFWITARARPGFEPGTSRTRSENHTPRPTSHWRKFIRWKKSQHRNSNTLVLSKSLENQRVSPHKNSRRFRNSSLSINIQSKTGILSRKRRLALNLMLPVRLELTTLGLWDLRPANWATEARLISILLLVRNGLVWCVCSENR